MTDRELLIGKRAAVLTRLQAALHEIGIEADLTQDTAGADRDQLRAYGAVAFGRAVGGAHRARMKDAFREANPAAPITPLLVASSSRRSTVGQCKSAALARSIATASAC